MVGKMRDYQGYQPVRFGEYSIKHYRQGSQKHDIIDPFDKGHDFIGGRCRSCVKCGCDARHSKIMECKSQHIQ